MPEKEKILGYTIFIFLQEATLLFLVKAVFLKYVFLVNLLYENQKGSVGSNLS